MMFKSDEPVYFMYSLITLMIWAFIATILSPMMYRWIPICILSLALILMSLFVIDKRMGSSCLDGPMF